MHTDIQLRDDDEEVEYAPPSTREPPYQSDVCPDGVLTFKGLEPENMFKGYYQYYYNDLDNNGLSLKERQMNERRQRDLKRGDEQIYRDMEEFDWSVGDVPGSKDAFKKNDKVPTQPAVDSKPAKRAATRPPATIVARRAASALALPTGSRLPTATQVRTKMVGKPGEVQKRGRFQLPAAKPPQPAGQPRSTSVERKPAVLASRSTLGYSKGRAALSAVRARSTTPALGQAEAVPKPRPLVDRTLSRSASVASTGSESTITPARFAQTQKSPEWKTLEFLSIFDVDEETDGGQGTELAVNDSDDEFQLSTDF